MSKEKFKALSTRSEAHVSVLALTVEQLEGDIAKKNHMAELDAQKLIDMERHTKVMEEQVQRQKADSGSQKLADMEKHAKMVEEQLQVLLECFRIFH